MWPWIFEGAYRVGSDTQESNNLESCAVNHCMSCSYLSRKKGPSIRFRDFKMQFRRNILA